MGFFKDLIDAKTPSSVRRFVMLLYNCSSILLTFLVVGINIFKGKTIAIPDFYWWILTGINAFYFGAEGIKYITVAKNGK